MFCTSCLTEKNRSTSSCFRSFLIPRDLEQKLMATATRTGWTKDLMSRTIAQHMRLKTVLISLPSSAKQQRKITKFFVVLRRTPRWQIVWFSIWDSTLVPLVLLKLRCVANLFLPWCCLSDYLTSLLPTLEYPLRLNFRWMKYRHRLVVGLNTIYKRNNLSFLLLLIW